MCIVAGIYFVPKFILIEDDNYFMYFSIKSKLGLSSFAGNLTQIIQKSTKLGVKVLFLIGLMNNVG